MSSYVEEALTLECEGSRMVAIATLPATPGDCGLVIVVGGPQYRVGSHRQFALLARSLAACGIAALRFDVRGMGDSEGDPRSFESIGADIRTAIDGIVAVQPGLRRVVLWGLCDAASAILFYAAADARVTGIVLLNPWVRTTEGIARAYLRYYYVSRLLSRDFWTKLLSGRFSAFAALRSFVGLARDAAGAGAAETMLVSGQASLPDRMASGFERFEGKVLLILSGDDLTAREFVDLVDSSERWRRLLSAPRVTRRDLPDANHTFSRREWRDRVAEWTAQWMAS